VLHTSQSLSGSPPFPPTLPHPFALPFDGELVKVRSLKLDIDSEGKVLACPDLDKRDAAAVMLFKETANAAVGSDVEAMEARADVEAEQKVDKNANTSSRASLRFRCGLCLSSAEGHARVALSSGEAVVTACSLMLPGALISHTKRGPPPPPKQPSERRESRLNQQVVAAAARLYELGHAHVVPLLLHLGTTSGAGALPVIQKGPRLSQPAGGLRLWAAVSALDSVELRVDRRPQCSPHGAGVPRVPWHRQGARVRSVEPSAAAAIRHTSGVDKSSPLFAAPLSVCHHRGCCASVASSTAGLAWGAVAGIRPCPRPVPRSSATAATSSPRGIPSGAPSGASTPLMHDLRRAGE